MSGITFARFSALVRSFPRRPAAKPAVPVWRDISFAPDGVASAFAALQEGALAFLFESASPPRIEAARYAVMGISPDSAWRLSGGLVEDWHPHRGWHSARTPADPLADLESLLVASDGIEVPEAGPFWNCAAGWFGYDVVRLIERLPNRPPASVEIPDALVMFGGTVVVIDRLESSARIIARATVRREASDEELNLAWDAANAKIDTVERSLAVAHGSGWTFDRSAPPASGSSSIERADFIARVDIIKEYIRAGDCFQALLSRRIDAEADFDSFALYAALRELNPSPYMFHVVADGTEIIGSSPELCVRLDDGAVTVRPIAGTRRRGATADEDEALGAELLADPKERAEHIMLVDLGRNDVGRISRFGSVGVTQLMAIERYSHVLHIVSEVSGSVDDVHGPMDVLRATFPAGTMTGAPKVRAMEIIDELEPASRGPYAGAIGWIGAGGKRMELAITIRSCVIADGVASVQAGAGIVADSVGEREWEETASKAAAVLTAIGWARNASSCR